MAANKVIARRSEDILSRALAFLPELRPRPNTGRFWLDALMLVLIAALQTAILPTIFGRFVSIDLMTPWLVISCVVQRMLPLSALIFIAALTLETKSGVPRGLYLCPYWIMGAVIMSVRPTFSWRHRVPWLSTYLVASLFVVGFEAFVYLLTSDLGEFTLVYGLRQALRIFLSVGFGMFLAAKWRSIDADEPVPA